MKLNELVVIYKKEKDKKVLEQIFSILEKTIKDKAKYVFYKQKFRIKNSEFRICDTKQVELEDVIQELYLKVLKLIENCDINKPFDVYLYSALWCWKPSFLNIDFFNNWLNKSLNCIVDEDGEEVYYDIPVFPKFEEEINIDDLFFDLTKDERKLLNLLKDDPELTQTELAKYLGVTQQRISQFYESIRKKCKSNLYF